MYIVIQGSQVQWKASVAMGWADIRLCRYFGWVLVRTLCVTDRSLNERIETHDKNGISYAALETLIRTQANVVVQLLRLRPTVDYHV